MTLKEQFWKNGYIFRMSTNRYKTVWGENLIDSHGYIPGRYISDDLYNRDSTINEHVVEVYTPNCNAGYFNELNTPMSEPIWRRYDYIYTINDLKRELNLSDNESIIVLN